MRDAAPIAGQHPRHSKAIRNLVIILMIAAYATIMYIGVDRILPTQSNDADLIEDLSYSVDQIGFFDSYAAMGWLYGALPDLARDLIVYSTALAFALIVMWRARGVLSSATGVLLLLGPIVLFLCLFNKETVLIPFLIAAYASLYLVRHDLRKFLAVAAIYAAYAVFFRAYFFIVTAVFGYLILIYRLSTGKRILLLAATLVGLLLMPRDVYRYLNDARDMVNLYRVGFSDAGFRTAFLNYNNDPTFPGFVVNYLFAFARLNLPLLFDVGLKELFLMISIGTYFALAFIGVRFGDHPARLSSLLFLSHVAVLTIFEPDLGSYMRHIGTAVIFLAPSLAVLDRLIAEYRARWRLRRAAARSRSRGRGPGTRQPRGSWSNAQQG